MPITTLNAEDASQRAFAMAYTAIVFDDGSPVLDEVYPTPHARRDAVVELLLTNHDEVPATNITAILAGFGGAAADTALQQIAWLYAEYHVDLHLGERLVDVGPSVLYTAFTDYGDGTTFAEHYGDRDERLAELRQRATNLAESYPLEFFTTADEEVCRKAIEFHLVAANGRLHLFDAQRQDTRFSDDPTRTIYLTE